MTDWNLEPAIAAFNAAALDSSRWQAAIDVVTAATGAFGSSLVRISGQPSPEATSASLEDACQRYDRDEWASRDERLKILPQMKHSGVGTEGDFVSVETMARHPYWQEWLAPFGLKWFAGVGIMFGDTVWCLSIQREASRGPYRSDEVAMLSRLSTHLSSAAALASALGYARMDGALAAFEFSRRAVILLDGVGSVVVANDVARRLLGNGLQIVNRRVISFNRDATIAFEQAVDRLLRAEHTLAAHPVVSLPGLNGGRLLAYLSRPSKDMLEALGFVGCIVTLVDLDDRSTASETLLIDVFGLTKAEATLATKLVVGGTLDQAARQLNISYETARTHLRNVFGKVGVNRQPQLTALVTLLIERTSSGPRSRTLS